MVWMCRGIELKMVNVFRMWETVKHVCRIDVRIDTMCNNGICLWKTCLSPRINSFLLSFLIGRSVDSKYVRIPFVKVFQHLEWRLKSRMTDRLNLLYSIQSNCRWVFVTSFFCRIHFFLSSFHISIAWSIKVPFCIFLKDWMQKIHCFIAKSLRFVWRVMEISFPFCWIFENLCILVSESFRFMWKIPLFLKMCRSKKPKYFTQWKQKWYFLIHLVCDIQAWFDETISL